MINKIVGYFIDCNGVIYTVAPWFESGSNAPYHVVVDGDTVHECGAFEFENGYLINNTYTLHKTLSDLAKVIEGDGNV